MKKLVTILILVIPFLSSSNIISRREDNFFKRVHAFIQISMNKIFMLMHLKNNFTTTDKNQLLLSMHVNLKAIAEKNYDIYKGIKQLNHSDNRKKSKEGLFNLDKLIDILIEENLTPNDRNANSSLGNMTTIKKREIGHNFIIESLDIPKDEEKALMFLKDYMNNVEGVEIDGFQNPVQRIKRIYEKNKVRVVRKKNLKAWRFQNSTENSDNVTETRRVFHGKHLKIRKFPFVASVHVMNEFVCAGSIVSRNMIITAASCLQMVYSTPLFLSQNPHGIEVRVGSDSCEESGEVYFTKTVIFHPNFKPDALENNLAILQIEKGLIFKKTNVKLRRVEYARTKELFPDVNEIWMLGWGDTSSRTGGNHFGVLAGISMNITNLEECKQIYSDKFVTDVNFCAGVPWKGVGACQRDIGGPAVTSDVLVGVVSFGPPVCGTAQIPTVFTNVGYYTDWIDNVIARNPVPKEIKMTNSSDKHFTKFKMNSNSQAHRSIQRVTQTLTTTPMMTLSVSDSRTHKKVVHSSATTKKGVEAERRKAPKALEVISYILNDIFSGGGGGGGDANYDDYDEESDEIGTVMTDNGPVPVKELAGIGNSNPESLRNGPTRDESDENPFMAILNRFLNFSIVPMSTQDRLERTFGYVTLSPLKTTPLKQDKHDKTKKPPSTKRVKETPNPILSAFSALQDTLGLNVVKFSAAKPEHVMTEESVEAVTRNQNSRVTEERVKFNETRDENIFEEDNYESEEMNLEQTSRPPRYQYRSSKVTSFRPSRSKALSIMKLASAEPTSRIKAETKPKKSSRKQLRPKLINPKGRGALKVPDHVVEILKKNFMKTNKFSNDSNELLVLLLKDGKKVDWLNTKVKAPVHKKSTDEIDSQE